MLERVHIENYKCLRDVTVDLGELTILIGPNDSGKSSFLDVVRDLGRVTNEQLLSIFNEDKSLANLVWRRQIERNIVWDAKVRTKFQTSDADFHYHVEFSLASNAPIEWLKHNGKTVFEIKQTSLQGPTTEVKIGQDRLPVQPGITVLAYNKAQSPSGNKDFVRKQLSHVSDALRSTIEFKFEPTKMFESSVPKPDESLDPSGQNLAAFLDALLTGPDRSAFASLEKDLSAAIPTLMGISLPAAENPPGAKCLRFVLAGNGPEPVTIPASQASTGALLLTAFLALSYSKTPDLLLIEEPENGLHPSRLKLVVDILRKMSVGEVGGRKRQIILTTHSPLLLNFARPEEVRVFFTDPEQGTQVKNMAEIPDADRLLKEFALGELWYLLGEEKLFEGQPA